MAKQSAYKAAVIAAQAEKDRHVIGHDIMAGNVARSMLQFANIAYC